MQNPLHSHAVPRSLLGKHPSDRGEALYRPFERGARAGHLRLRRNYKGIRCRGIPHVPVRQWVLALPIPLRLLLTAQPNLW